MSSDRDSSVKCTPDSSVGLSVTWAEAQNGRGNDKGSRQDQNGHGWDIKLAVPGEPGNDYPTLGAIPRTTFSCAGKEPGYYADTETDCQAFRVCTIGSTYGFQSFLCPNGTLFNQAVLVCDWWMKVKCENTQQFIDNNKNKFENLKLGPELMKDIKKMLTHPMRNPYDRSLMKSSQIVMQEYKAPNGQLFPNGALLSGPERVPNNVYVSAKQIQQNLIQNNPSDFIYSASTHNPQYLANPALANNHLGSLKKNEDFFQKQRQSKQYSHNGRTLSKQDPSQSTNLIANSQKGQFIQSSKSNFNNNANPQLSQVTRPSQLPTFSQIQTNTAQATQTSSSQNNQRSQHKRRRLQTNDNRRIPQTNNEKQAALADLLTETQNIQHSKSNHANPANTPPSLPKFSSEIKGKVGRDLKDNLVSRITDIPTTVIPKTSSRILQETKVSKPKSHVTIKTWIIKPNLKKTKKSRQIADPTPYTYPRPSLPSPTPTDILIDNTTPYSFSSSQSENIISMEIDSAEPYIYNRPTIAAKQIQTTELEITPILMTPTNPTFLPSSPLILPSTSSVPTKLSRYYLTPTPFTATNRLYLPPSRQPTTLPRLSLSPNAQSQPVYQQSAQLQASPNVPSSTTPFDDYLNQSSFSLSKNSRSNNYNNNLIFADILTKEKLDSTVNDIVKDTDNVLKTASPPVYNQYRQNLPQSLDIRESDYYISTKTLTDSSESLTSQSPLQTTTEFSKISQSQTATPARSLVPPDASFSYQNTNPLSRLPYYKESGLLNTIERTVSIKITIPEHIAKYLFRNQSEADFDKLEILNTDSSNYLVLSNSNKNSLTNKNVLNFIPIAKLSDNNNIPNISTSQALVYSFFSDSINLGRQYRNLAEQEVLSSTATPTPAQFQNLNNQQISDITNKISNLTSSQFSSNHFYNIDRNANIISAQPNYINQPIPFTGNSKFSTQHNARQIQSSRYNGISSQPTQDKSNSAQFNLKSVQPNPNEIYSGQLYRWPVPEVTNQIYNRPISENLIISNTLQQHTTPMLTLQRNTNQNNAAEDLKQSSPEVEFIKAEIINLGPEPSNEPEQSTSTETLTNLLNNGNGISAHLEDKILGTIPHPLEENKLVTYRKDRSYYLYTKLDDNPTDENVVTNTQTNTNTQQNDQQIQNSNAPDDSSFQLIPSVNYELQDEKEQQLILDAFQIDEFGAPRHITKPTSTTEKTKDEEIMTSSVGYSVEHPTAARRSDQLTIDPVYSGPSSYKAPQSSIGSLENRQDMQSNFNAKLEDFDNNNENGYPKQRPAQRFVY